MGRIAAQTAAARMRADAPVPRAQAVSGPSAAGARRHRGTRALPLLRVGQAVEAGRGHHRDAGSDPAPVEGGPDRARALLVSRVRDNHAAARALPRHAPRLCRAEPLGHDPVREVRTASAPQPAERALCPRGH